MTSLFSRAAAIAALLLTPLWAQASFITLAGCDSCNGAMYQLFYFGTSEPEPVNDPAHETYRITLRVIPNDIGSVVPNAVGIDAAAIKISSGAVFSAALIDAPGGAGAWGLVPGGISAGSGCNGSGVGFTCADWQGAGVGAPLVDVLDFIFDLTVDNGQLLTALNAAHVKARFVDAQGRKVGALLSNDINLSTIEPPTPSEPEPEPEPLPEPGPPAPAVNPVPAPATWLLVLFGGLLAARRTRRAA